MMRLFHGLFLRIRALQIPLLTSSTMEFTKKKSFFDRGSLLKHLCQPGKCEPWSENLGQIKFSSLRPEISKWSSHRICWLTALAAFGRCPLESKVKLQFLNFWNSDANVAWQLGSDHLSPVTRLWKLPEWSRLEHEKQGKSVGDVNLDTRCVMVSSSSIKSISAFDWHNWLRLKIATSSPMAVCCAWKLIRQETASDHLADIFTLWP